MIVLGAAVFNTWLLQGLFSPCRVTSGSMAETLLGVHRDVVCGSCGFRFACDAAPRLISRRAACPNCGYLENEIEPLPALDGDRVLIDRTAFCVRSPRRWEIAAFADPRDAAQTIVKRVVGLPGETVQIRHGDVYIDGEIQRKTLAQQRAIAVLVHDAGFPPHRDGVPVPRWRGEKAESQWGSAAGRFVRPATAENDPIDWLVYHHRGDAPIQDDCGYNASLSRQFETAAAVTDLALSFRLIETFGSGSLVIRMHDGYGEFQVRIDATTDEYRVSYNDRPVPEACGKVPAGRDGLRCEVWLFDRQLLLAFDGRTVVTWPYEPTEPPVGRSSTPSLLGRSETPSYGTKPTAQPLAIGAKGLGVVLENLRVYRDVYYTQQGWRGLNRPTRLGEDEFFVLGDNSPVSVDSRAWAEGESVKSNSLIGKPLIVIIPVRNANWFGRDVQVPDLGKIRYIR